jgi:transcriptional regulator with XRE-family HTH domain
MKDRIRQIRKYIGLSQTEFGVEIGCSQTAVAKYEGGQVIPDKPVRLLICQKFNVNETWLETGEGDPYKEGLIPCLVHALQQMPDVQAMLEAKLPKVSDDTFRRMNDAFKAFMDELQ